MPKNCSHRKSGVAFHFGKIIKQIHKVIYVQTENIGVFNGINVINVFGALNETAGRIYPFVSAAKIFADFFPVFDKISTDNSAFNKIAMRTNFVGIMSNSPFLNDLNEILFTSSCFRLSLSLMYFSKCRNIMSACSFIFEGCSMLVGSLYAYS